MKKKTKPKKLKAKVDMYKIPGGNFSGTFTDPVKVEAGQNLEIEHVIHLEEKDIIDEVLEVPKEPEKKKIIGPVCTKCNEGQLITEGWARKTAPNQYKLYNKTICKNCKAVTIEDVAEVDKNTDGTRKLLMDLKMGRVAVDHKRNKKSPVKEEIDVNTLFAE